MCHLYPRYWGIKGNKTNVLTIPRDFIVVRKTDNKQVETNNYINYL